MESPHAGIAPFCADDVSRAPQEGLFPILTNGKNVSFELDCDF